MTEAIFDKGIAPMEPTLHRSVLDEDGWIHQVKWDGVRIIAYVSHGQVVLRNRKGNIRTAHYPELQQLKALASASPCILDGEMIAFDENRNVSFSQVLKRDLLINETRLAQAIQRIPVHYMIFDIPYYKGKSIHQRSLYERQILLQNLFPQPIGPVYAVESYKDGQALYQSTNQLGMEGLVSKKLDSAYLYGAKSDLWRKIKHLKRLNAVVGGVSVKGGTVNSLLLGVYEGKQLRYIGKAGSGLDSHILGQLTGLLPVVTPSFPCPFQTGIALPKTGVHFLPPIFVVEVEYLEWTADWSLRTPIVLGFRNKDPLSCQWT